MLGKYQNPDYSRQMGREEPKKVLSGREGIVLPHFLWKALIKVAWIAF